MNLANQELSVALSLLIKRNPIVEVALDEGDLVVKYLNKHQDRISLPENVSSDPAVIDYDQIHDAISQYVNEKIKEIPVHDQSDLLNTKYTELKEYIDLQLEYLKNQPEPQPVAGIETKNTTVYEQYDDTELKEWIQSLLDKIEPVIENHTHEETTVIKEEIDYDEVQKLIDNALENSPKAVVGIEHYFGDVFLIYSDGSKQVITNVLTPILTVYGGGGGGTGATGPRGFPGLSAYQIAVNNGFQGSEQQWLDSLKGDSPVPEDGTIEYSANGQIESVTVGTRTTLFNRTIDGVIESIEKDDYIKLFTRDITGRIIGWNIEYK